MGCGASDASTGGKPPAPKKVSKPKAKNQPIGKLEVKGSISGPWMIINVKWDILPEFKFAPGCKLKMCLRQLGKHGWNLAEWDIEAKHKGETSGKAKFHYIKCSKEDKVNAVVLFYNDKPIVISEKWRGQDIMKIVETKKVPPSSATLKIKDYYPTAGRATVEVDVKLSGDGAVDTKDYVGIFCEGKLIGDKTFNHNLQRTYVAKVYELLDPSKKYEVRYVSGVNQKCVGTFGGVKTWEEEGKTFMKEFEKIKKRSNERAAKKAAENKAKEEEEAAYRAKATKERKENPPNFRGLKWKKSARRGDYLKPNTTLKTKEKVIYFERGSDISLFKKLTIYYKHDAAAGQHGAKFQELGTTTRDYISISAPSYNNFTVKYYDKYTPLLGVNRDMY